MEDRIFEFVILGLVWVGFAGVEGEEGTVHGCRMPSPVPKFKLTAYGVHILRKDIDTKSASSA